MEKKRNQQFQTMKFKSLRLKEFGYNIKLTPKEALENSEMIELFDNQFLRSIRRITGNEYNEELLNQLRERRDELKRGANKRKTEIKEVVVETNKELGDKDGIDEGKLIKEDVEIKRIKSEIGKINRRINKMIFIPEYITIVMEHKSHYNYMYKNGVYINNKKYVRFSCAAGQARVSTVTFVEESVAKKLKEVMDNGRDLEAKFSPSKLNAYIGLGGSATQVVSTPRFCVIPDYVSSNEVRVNFVTETPDNQDDKIEEKVITLDFERFDGMGLISPYQSEKWAKELGLDYIPAQWCVRQSFLKGQLCTFDIHEFCKSENAENYNIKTCYKDEYGNDVIVDLRDIDVICTTSMFKLWKSYNSLEQYQQCCEENGLNWGVSLYTPREDKNILTMNYQFNQTINLDKEDVKKLCEKSVGWIRKVNGGDIYSTLLFLLGTDVTEEKIKDYLQCGGNYWAKCLALDHELIKDKYIRKNVYDLMRSRIKKMCLGNIFVDGNFQVLVSDPFAFMEYACGKEVKGLLGKREYYSNYWNNKGVELVDSMRAPLTSRFEHLKLPLVQNERLDKWYRYCYTGIIVNVHGTETLNWAGSDWDYDIVATTSDETVLKTVYENELPVVYEAPKPESKLLTDDDLFESDKFSFGSIIGSITNKSTSAYALIPTLKPESDELKTTMNRIRMCTKLQSAQIDKAKIGREVKGIPKTWLNYEKIKENDSAVERDRKNFNNKILLNRHPYFFRYLYRDTNNKLKRHNEGYDISCRQLFGISLNELLAKGRKTLEEQEYIDKYEEFMPVIDSDSPMNLICKHIESINFEIRNNYVDETGIYKRLKLRDLDTKVDFEEVFNAAIERVDEFMEALKFLKALGIGGSDADGSEDIRGMISVVKENLEEICEDTSLLADVMVDIFYIHRKYNKSILWMMFGKDIFENTMKKKGNIIKFPLPDKEGDIEYLNDKFSVKEVRYGCLQI